MTGEPQLRWAAGSAGQELQLPVPALPWTVWPVPSVDTGPGEAMPNCTPGTAKCYQLEVDSGGSRVQLET